MPRAVRFHQTGGPEVLQIETIDVPPPGAGEVRIAVKALGLNRAESMFRLGQYLEQPTFPARLGYEAAGTVEAVGPGVLGSSHCFAIFSVTDEPGLRDELSEPTTFGSICTRSYGYSRMVSGSTTQGACSLDRIQQ